MAIYIASHEYRDIDAPEGYRPLFVGADRCDALTRRPDWRYDDEGDDVISSENDIYCELTGVYWLWKQCDDPIVGLVHYRRYLADPISGNPLAYADAEVALGGVDCLVSNKYWPNSGGTSCSIGEQYRHCHSSIDLVILRDVIARAYPSYLESFDVCVKRNWLYARNIVVFRRTLFERYCEFLFGVLSAFSGIVDPRSHRDGYQRRLLGFLGERLLNVFIEAHGLRVAEYSICDPSGEADIEDGTQPMPMRERIPEELANYKPVYRGKDYRRVFDAKFYLEHNPDILEKVGVNPESAFSHFVHFGVYEGRQAHPSFSIASYMNAHPELNTKLGEDDRLAWCDNYLSRWRGDLFSFGFEHYEFDGRPWKIRNRKVLRAYREAHSQGVID